MTSISPTCFSRCTAARDSGITSAAYRFDWVLDLERIAPIEELNGIYPPLPAECLVNSGPGPIQTLGQARTESSSSSARAKLRHQGLIGGRLERLLPVQGASDCVWLSFSQSELTRTWAKPITDVNKQ
ncbi:MAG: hypothetical protein R3B58_03400 [Phycisphaerales bacterium]